MARIFIVEDEAMIALELADRLRGMGHEVCGHAARGDTAVDAIVRLEPDLVILDINLGRGLSGLEVAAAVRARSPSGVLFTTAYSAASLRAQVGDTPVLAKPYRSEQLAAMVARALAQR